MPVGQMLVVLAFLTAFAATVWSVPSLQGGRGSRIAKGFFTAHAALLVLALVVLATLFLRHRFEYEYVAANSSRALSPSLTLASMWAGQEGSILLWAAIGAIVGVALAVQPGRLSAPALVFAGIAQLFMIGLLLVRSPFRLSGLVPADGMGLNPLLEDPWMVSHPPTLFVGYAAMLPPFALGAAALWRGEYAEWNRRVWPWTLFAVVSLGLGIVLGGIWAYKVLGWGGYWGWDPVENASLVPWLMAVALLHGLMIQRTLGAMTRTNLLLASLGWLSVVGGTYLTRSGVLSDFSVHSFADTGLGPVLTGFLLTFALGAAGLLAWRWRAIAPMRVEWLNVSREAALWLGLMTVVTLAVMVAAGTTMPLLTGLAGRPASVRPEFYHAVTMPFALVILLLMAVAPVLRWSRQAGTSWLPTFGAGGVAGAVALLAGYALGLRDMLWLALLGATGWMLGLNAWVAWRLFRRGWAYGAGYLGHVGVAVMALGIAVSGSFGRTERVSLTQGETREVLGYRLTYMGHTDEGKRGATADVRVERGTWSMVARPRMMESPRGDGMMHTPALDLLHDLYVAPVEIGARPKAVAADAEPQWLLKNEPLTLNGTEYVFRGFRMEHTGDQYLAYADVDVRHGGERSRVSPGLRASAAGTQPVPAEIAGLGMLSLARMDADHGRIAVIPPAEQTMASVVTIDLSTKPWVNLVWVGALLMLIGTAMAGVRRAREQRGSPGRMLQRPGNTPAEAEPKPV